MNGNSSNEMLTVNEMTHGARETYSTSFDCVQLNAGYPDYKRLKILTFKSKQRVSAMTTPIPSKR